MTPALEILEVAEIAPSPDQNRTEFDQTELEELAASISEVGLLQPVTVRPAGAMGYFLIAGERRLRACRDVLGWATIPAIVRDDDDDNAFRTLAENMIRVDPGPLEEARGLAIVADKHGLAPAELARRLGKTPRWVRDRLALLNLADDVAHFIQTGALPLGRGVLISDLDANRQRLALQAHERGIAPDAFRALVAKLEADQAADSMFDPDDFMRLETWCADAESVAAAAVITGEVVRERPCGVSEIAELLEVKSSTVHQWRARGIFPDPELRVGGSPAWWESTVRVWARETGR